MKGVLIAVLLLFAASCSSKGGDGAPLIETHADRLMLGQIVYRQALEIAYRWETKDVDDAGKGIDVGIVYVQSKVDYESLRAEKGGAFEIADLDSAEVTSATYRREHPITDPELITAFDTFELAYEAAKLALADGGAVDFNEATALKLLRALRDYRDAAG